MSSPLHLYLSAPYTHAVVFLLITAVLFVLARPGNANALYTSAGVVYAVFILVNSIMIYYAESIWTYFFTSLLFSIVYLVAVELICSTYVRIAKVAGSGESAMVFLIIIYHPIVMLIVLLVKWIIG